MDGTTFPSCRPPARSTGPEAPHEHVEVHVEDVDYVKILDQQPMELSSARLQLQDVPRRGPEPTK